MNTTTGVIFGAVLGFLSSFGFMSMNIKKSQRETLFPIIATVTTIFGSIVGGRVGYRIERSDKINSVLGLDKIQYYHYKVGRFWESKTEWVDIKQAKHSLRTFKGPSNTVSYYNGSLQSNHGNSASSVNTSKYHMEAREKIFSKLREKYGDEYLKLIKQ